MDQAGGTESGTIDSVLAHNRAFVAGGEFARYATDKYPDKKLAVVSCMDTRLTELLAAALGLKNGDAKIIKVAGAEVAHPFGSVMRSLLIAVCELGVESAPGETGAGVGCSERALCGSLPSFGTVMTAFVPVARWKRFRGT